VGAGKLLLLTSHPFYRLPARVVVCFYKTVPKKPGRRRLFKNWFPVIVAGLVLAGLSPRVPGVVIVQKGGHLVVCGSGSSLQKILPVKSGRQWRWVGVPSFTDRAFAERNHY